MSLRSSIGETAARYFANRYPSGLRALILTGSMARGEATAIEEDGLCRVLGDAEFLLIFERSAGQLPAAAVITADCVSVEERLRRSGIACSVGADRAYPEYLCSMKPHIYGYELKSCGQVLRGDGTILSLIPPFTAGDIPYEDGWQLLMNRLIELMKPAAELRVNRNPVCKDVQYRTAKVYLDMATSLLLFLNAFEAGYDARRRRLEQLAEIQEGPFPMGSFAERVAEATDYKLGRRGGDCFGRCDDLKEAVGWSHRLWRWELARLTQSEGASGVSDERLCARWIESQSMRCRLQGWLSQFRKPILRRDPYSWPRWVAAMGTASPRYGVYRVASKVIFQLPELLSGDVERDSWWREINRELPLRRGIVPGEPAWRQLCRNVVWNYEQLLIGTRA